MTTFAPPVIVGLLFIFAASLLKEPSRRQLMAILVGGAGAAYLSGGGLGIWEFGFTAVMTVVAWRGLESYGFIGVAWLLHTGWDLLHHFHGHPIIPFLPGSSLGCAITDTILAAWFLASAPSIFGLANRHSSETLLSGDANSAIHVRPASPELPPAPSPALTASPPPR